MVNPTVSQKP